MKMSSEWSTLQGMLNTQTNNDLKLLQAHLKLNSTNGEIKALFILKTSASNQITKTSRKTGIFPFQHANLGQLYTESKKEQIGRSNSLVVVRKYNLFQWNNDYFYILSSI